MQHYACGFLFSPDRARVLLIRKRRPAWQAGKLNGVGGKVEPGETPADAMAREFREEAGLSVAGWEPVLRLAGPDWVGHFFRAFGDVDAARSMTDEQLEIHPAATPPAEVIPNLRWMIPMLLDDDVVGRTYAVEVRVDRNPVDP
ncbi:MAG TPA: NUDIX domain-containing protein [Humisphaera sp.]